MHNSPLEVQWTLLQQGVQAVFLEPWNQTHLCAINQATAMTSQLQVAWDNCDRVEWSPDWHCSLTRNQHLCWLEYQSNWHSLHIIQECSYMRKYQSMWMYDPATSRHMQVSGCCWGRLEWAPVPSLLHYTALSKSRACWSCHADVLQVLLYWGHSTWSIIAGTHTLRATLKCRCSPRCQNAQTTHK